MTASTTVTPKYMRTEIGNVPIEWDVRKLIDISSKITDGDHSTPVRASQGYYLLSARNVLDGRIDVSDVDYVERAEYVRMRTRCAPEAGDVLISCSGTIGRVAVVPPNFESVLVRSAALIKIDHTKADGRYVQYSLQASEAQKQISTSVNQAAQPNLFLNHIEKLQVAVPTLDEQRAIAEALSDVDALLAGLDRLIAKKRDLKQAAMQQLLTGRTRLPGFEGKWKIKRIGDFTDCTAGGTPSTGVSEYWGGSIRWMNSGEIHLKRVQEVEGRITEAGLHSSSTKLIPPKCVLVGLAGQGRTRGTVAMNLVELCTNQSIAAIFPSFEFVSDYLYYNLDFRYEELREMSTGGGGRGGLNLTIIKAIPIPLPSLEEQTAIASALSDADDELTTLEMRRDKTRALKQAMMQELLTGRIRLV